MSRSASVDKKEVAQFSAHAADWWNPKGAMKPLHRLNPVRLEYVRDTIVSHFKLGRKTRDCLKGISILDIGCGGGLLTEPMTRMGAEVTGLDASHEAVNVAQVHARDAGLDITYMASSVEDYCRGPKRYDVITALEILEHVADIQSFLRSAAALLKPNGIIILSTVNRTPKSFLLGIIAAEFILKWVPKGTHDWRKFLKPSELAAHLQKAGYRAADIVGVIFDPLNNRFSLQKEKVGVNYMMSAFKRNA